MRTKKINRVGLWMATSVASLMIAATAQAELVGHWTFDETSGTVAADSSGNGYDGIATSPVWTTNGVIGGALRLNGIDSGVEVLNASLMPTVSNQITVAFWVSRDPVADQIGNGFAAYAAADNARELNNHMPHGTTTYWDAGYVGTARQRVSINDASLLGPEWHHWAFTKNADTGDMKIYQDGAVVVAGTNLTASLAELSKLYIGCETGSKMHYSGVMDDFRVYDEELSSTEVSNLYTAVTLDYVIAYGSASPREGSIPLNVNFDGSSSLSTGTITDYSWDFGDGATGSGSTASHTYTVIGTNTATLTVTDESGNTDTKQFEIVTEAAGDPIVVDDTLAIDFGGTAATEPNYNDMAFDALNLGGLVRLSDGAATGVRLDVVMDGGSQRNQGGYVAGNGCNTTDANIYSDGIALWDSGASNNSITLTFSGLDDDLAYDIVGGSSRSDTYIESFSTDWTVGGITQYADCTVENGYVTFTNAASSGGTLVITITDPFYRVGVSQVQLTAVAKGIPPPPPPVLVIDSNVLTWDTTGPYYLYTVQTNSNLTDVDGWGIFTTVIGTVPTTTVELPQDQPALFYKVDAEINE